MAETPNSRLQVGTTYKAEKGEHMIIDYDQILDEVSEMTLSDVLGVLLEADRTDLVASWDSIQEFLLERVRI